MALERFVAELVAATRLEAKAWLVDPSGGVAGELERLLAQASELSLEGAGPREWWSELVARIDDGRAAGKPTDDAINLLTSHSSKGLEWPVVVALGLWRDLKPVSARGLRLIPDARGEPQVYFDGGSVPTDTKDARERERLRELVRLLYVTLTRPRRALVLPWAEGFGGKPKGASFAELWGAELAEVAEIVVEKVGADLAVAATLGGEAVVVLDVAMSEGREAAVALPARVLPHQLAHKPDLARQARHESALDEAVSSRASSEDAIEYGLWWHETLEFVPWEADADVLENYARTRLELARAAWFGARAETEWVKLLASRAWRQMTKPRWTRLAELAVFAPLDETAWMDGVIDLVLHDAEARELWVVDWKTNRRRAMETEAEFLARLAEEYAPQLHAYGRSLAAMFPGCEVRRLVYGTAVGEWIEVAPAEA
ncbi:MAG: PD-(D/E)XK nuclease family protein [Burkholderiales bacterium]|nr:PD-(D/E)XK nuclease family protein [Opitutaceae bacterium]